MNSYREIARPQLAIDEGNKSKPYRDSLGFLTAGIGRNLDAVPFSPDEIALMFENDLNRAEKSARALVPGFDRLTLARQAVVVNMAFNLGQTKLAKFVRMLAAINSQRWADAAKEMRASDWFTQVGDRAVRLAKAMEQG